MDPGQRRRMGKTALISVALIALILAAVPTIGSLRGEGISWQSLGTFAAGNQAADALASGDKDRISETINFADSESSQSIQKTVVGLSALGNQGIHLTAGKALIEDTGEEDGFPTTVLRFVVEDGSTLYQMDFLATASEGKAMLICLEDIRYKGDTEPLMKAWYPDWLPEMESILCTYNPG